MGDPITIFYEMQLQSLQKVPKDHLIRILKGAGILKQEYTIQEGKRKGKEKTIVQLIQVIRDNKVSEDKIKAYLIKEEVKNVKIVSDDQTTHYKVWKDGSVADPYKLYQAENTQGFCQMFAWFIATGDTSDFIEVKEQSKMTSEKFHNLALNTQICAQKTIDLIKREKDVEKKFNEGFLIEKTDDTKGIADSTDLAGYLKDFEKINADLRRVKDYVIDQKTVVSNENLRARIQREYHGLPVFVTSSSEDTTEATESQTTVRRSKRVRTPPEIYGKKKPLTATVGSPKLPPDPDLCVQPTAGETQYESFLTVFASIMGATSERNEYFNPSPYDLLCHLSKILVMPVYRDKRDKSGKRSHPEPAEIDERVNLDDRAWKGLERGEFEEGIPPEPQIPEGIPPRAMNSSNTKRKRRRTRRKRRRRSSTSR